MAEAQSSRTWVWHVAVVAGLIGLGLLFWEKQARHDLMAKRFGVVVEDRIYRSGKLTPASMRSVVEDNDIRTIIDLGAWEPGTPEEALERAVADELGVERVVFDLEGDATGDPNAYLKTLQIMTDPARQPVLVHCGAGTERTGCAVILYRHIIEGVDVETAYEEARRVGHSPRRNPRLKAVLDRWLEPISDAYTDGLETIPGTPDD